MSICSKERTYTCHESDESVIVHLRGYSQKHQDTAGLKKPTFSHLPLVVSCGDSKSSVLKVQYTDFKYKVQFLVTRSSTQLEKTTVERLLGLWLSAWA